MIEHTQLNKEETIVSRKPLSIGTVELERMRGFLTKYIEYSEDPPESVLKNFEAARKEVERILCDERFAAYHWHMSPEFATQYRDRHLQEYAYKAVTSLTAQIKTRR